MITPLNEVTRFKTFIYEFPQGEDNFFIPRY